MLCCHMKPGQESPSDRHCQRGANSGHVFFLSSPRAGQLLLISVPWLKLVKILKCINKRVCVHIYIERVQDSTWSLILMAFLSFPFSISTSHINWSSFRCLHGSCEVWLSPKLANLVCVFRGGRKVWWKGRTGEGVATVTVDVWVGYFKIFHHFSVYA